MSTDPLYRDLSHEAKQVENEQQKQSPRAFALRDELNTLYRSLDLTDPKGALAIMALDVLALVLRHGEDIAPPEERTLRMTFGLLKGGA